MYRSTNVRMKCRVGCNVDRITGWVGCNTEGCARRFRSCNYLCFPPRFPDAL